MGQNYLVNKQVTQTVAAADAVLADAGTKFDTALSQAIDALIATPPANLLGGLSVSTPALIFDGHDYVWSAVISWAEQVGTI